MTQKSESKIRIPTKSGLEEARRRLKELRRKEPTPELIKIIDEVTREKSDKPLDDTDGIAAKPRRKDLDL